MTGPAPDLFRKIAKSEFFLTNINFEVKRGQDLNVAAKILNFEYMKGFSETTKPNLDRFVIDTAEHKEELELAARRVLDILDIMSSIFLPKDKLLTSAGILPVYYWLIKKTDEKKHNLVREFLLRFEEGRSINRELVRTKPDSREIKNTYVKYDQFNRSTNNAQSHSERFIILMSEFVSHIHKG